MPNNNTILPGTASAGEYPELPVPVFESWAQGGLLREAGFTAEQMRAYVDADRAMRAAQAAPAAAAAPNWTDAANWLRNNYQDYPNIVSLCEGMIAASPYANTTCALPINWENAMPGGKHTDKWESSRAADYNRGWNAYRKEARKKLKELAVAPTPAAQAADSALEDAAPTWRCQHCIDRHDGIYGSWAAPCPYHDDDGKPRPAARAALVSQQPGTTGLVGALEDAQRAINSMKVEAETAAQGDEQMRLEACETISNEGLQADMAIRAALVSHRQAPAQAAPAAVASPGWKLVPVEPTPEMWKAARAVPDPNPPYPPHYALVWEAMLSAAPTTQPAPRLPDRAARAPADSVQDLRPVHDAVTIELLNERVAYLDRKLKEADSVLEDAARWTTKRERAIRQGREIAASDGYFEARPQIDSNDRRKVFQAGFERGWDEARKQGQTMTEPTDDELDALLAEHWPAFATSGARPLQGMRAAMRDALAKWSAPQQEGSSRD